IGFDDDAVDLGGEGAILDDEVMDLGDSEMVFDDEDVDTAAGDDVVDEDLVFDNISKLGGREASPSAGSFGMGQPTAAPGDIDDIAAIDVDEDIAEVDESGESEPMPGPFTSSVTDDGLNESITDFLLDDSSSELAQESTDDDVEDLDDFLLGGLAPGIKAGEASEKKGLEFEEFVLEDVTKSFEEARGKDAGHVYDDDEIFFEDEPEEIAATRTKTVFEAKIEPLRAGEKEPDAADADDDSMIELDEDLAALEDLLDQSKNKPGT
ncbi:hypothetical protein, partial [Oceanidesulfovibrio marinus]